MKERKVKVEEKKREKSKQCWGVKVKDMGGLCWVEEN